MSLSTQLGFMRNLRYVPVSTGRGLLEQPSLPSGSEHSNMFGRHFQVRKTFTDDYYHGIVRLSRFAVPELQRLMELMRQRATASDRDRICFLDTETTGIQGGTGMCPFMVGVGHFSGDDFQMIQFFMRDFDEEPSMLCALGELLGGFDLVITYNGATFDVPLLETRFTLARLDNPFERMGHFDLLNTARRLWRNGHGSCRLTALEKLIMFMRGPDVPGAAIPRVYFDFVQHRDVPELPSVFTHNVYDVVTLAALTIHATDCVTNEPATFDSALDQYSLARVVENSADWRRAADLYERALQGGLPDPHRTKALENLSVIYRRAGEHTRAFEICAALMQGEAFSMAGYEGAAVYHERFGGDVESALRVVEEGLHRLDDSAAHKRSRSLLHTRWQRLQQKVIGF